MQGKFVILFHSGCGTDHYDLMLEMEDYLATWKFASFPTAGATCLKLPPHRKAYLTYQGPVSDNRGEVTRIDKGRCDLTETPEGLHANLCGKKISGDFLLAEISNDEWSFTQF